MDKKRLKGHTPLKAVYLAGPYSDPNTIVREQRYLRLLEAEYALIKARGFCVMNPIGMCHSLSKMYKMPTGYKYWQSRDRELINRCDEVYVLTMQGWKESVGVTDEIQYAKSIGRPVIYLTPSAVKDMLEGKSEDVKTKSK